MDRLPASGFGGRGKGGVRAEWVGCRPPGRAVPTYYLLLTTYYLLLTTYYLLLTTDYLLLTTYY